MKGTRAETEEDVGATDKAKSTLVTGSFERCSYERMISGSSLRKVK